MDCPACRSPLVARKLDQCPFDACGRCGGVSVPILRSLELWAAMAGAGEPLPAHAPEGVSVRAAACVSCGGPPEDFRYLEHPDVILQRCSPCGRLWIPGDQQEGARRAWERRVGREAQRLERTADVIEALRPVRHAVAGLRGTSSRVGGDVDAEARWLAAERARDRDPK